MNCMLFNILYNLLWSVLHKSKWKELCAGLSKRLTLPLPGQRAMISMPDSQQAHTPQGKYVYVFSRYSLTSSFEPSEHRDKTVLSQRSCGEGKLISLYHVGSSLRPPVIQRKINRRKINRILIIWISPCIYDLGKLKNSLKLSKPPH